MDQATFLNRKIETVEFCDIDGKADCDVIRVAVEVFEVQPDVKHAALIIDLILKLDAVAVYCEGDSALVLDELTDPIELGAQKLFVNRRIRRKIEIVREARCCEVR